MKLRDYIILYLLGFFVSLGVSLFQESPGYMDASYYYMGGMRISEGYGFTEQVLWNYLDDPSGLPHPSHMYWMPLTSIFAAAGIWLTGTTNFTSAKLGFLALSGLVPILSASLSYSLVLDRRNALLAGVLAAFSFFYAPYLPTTDSFVLYMVLGASILLIFKSQLRKQPLSISASLLFPLFLGLISGLMHLARPDGVVWFIICVGMILFIIQPAQGALRDWRGRFVRVAFCILGYILVMGPWLWHNFMVFNQFFPPGGDRAFWFVNYDELFIYPASLLTFSRWWGKGLEEILRARLWAVGQNLQTTFAVQGGVLLSPFIVVGLWKLRKEYVVWFGGLVWGATVLLMTIVFPFAGARGGFFHSGAALQPLFWAVSPLGLDSFIDWGRRVRGWNTSRARGVFQIGLIVMVIVLTIFSVTMRVIGSDISNSSWDHSYSRYRDVEVALLEFGATPETTVMVNDAPGYYVASRRPAISIPYGNLNTLLEVAKRYQARYLLVEIDQLQGNERLYSKPGDRPGLRYLRIFQGIQIYEIAVE